MKEELEASGCYESTIPIPLKAGSLVRLNSGGPTMTYTGQKKKGKCKCIWFMGEPEIWGSITWYWFSPESLVVIK